ncbi:MAG: transglutaminase-like domain-containing protein [Bacteroidota bacterium]
MTSKYNFISSIRYELQQIKQMNWSVDKFTKERKDADQEFKSSPTFGSQLKRSPDAMEDAVKGALIGEIDPLTRAKKVYDMVKFHFVWDGSYGDHTEYGVKKAFEEKKGNVADINITLIAALRSAGFDVEPVLIGTRDVGRPIELHPVLTDFNYVIAKLELRWKDVFARCCG